MPTSPPPSLRGLLPRRPPAPGLLLLSGDRPHLLALPQAGGSWTGGPPRPGRHQARAANFIARPRVPYHFTQLVQLSDGSTYTVRTTSPAPMYRSARDRINHVMWNPNEKSLRNVEMDEAGRLAAFRERFGRGFDLETGPQRGSESGAAAAAAAATLARNKKEARAGAGPDNKHEAAAAQDQEGDVLAEDDGDFFAELISGYHSAAPPQKMPAPGPSTGKGKDGKK